MTTVPVDMRERLILALDVPSAEAAFRLLEQAGDAVTFVKVGLELFTAAGPEFVQRLRDLKKRVFLDLKFLDIEETVRRATSQVAMMGVDFLTVHANRKALNAAVKGRSQVPNSSLKILAVTVLTNYDSQDLRDMGIQLSVAELVSARAALAAEVGCDGVVASGEEPQAIRQRVGSKLVVVTPGIRPAGTEIGDHARATTPARAIGAGSDYLVVGRPIRDAVNPRAAAEQILDEMRQAFLSRAS
ncbi:orotidine 5'-phosphate decarboxylase [Nitrospira sp.]|nr:orotidine 5'-phosphate decarboxylase [Nitrospira sp.]